jgi:hypothetical protein
VVTVPTEFQIAMAFGSMIQVISCFVVIAVLKGGAMAAGVAEVAGPCEPPHPASTRALKIIAQGGMQAFLLMRRVFHIGGERLGI